MTLCSSLSVVYLGKEKLARLTDGVQVVGKDRATATAEPTLSMVLTSSVTGEAGASSGLPVSVLLKRRESWQAVQLKEHRVAA